MVQTDEERKAKRKEVRDRPENKAKRKIISKKYDSRPEVKAKAKERRDRPENKAKKKERQQRPENKAKDKQYRNRTNVRTRIIEYSKDFRDKPENKAKAQERRDKPENKAKDKDTRDTNRLNVLQHYSKLHSNSDIPCCRCCRLNENIDFLSLDHISGKREMDAEPELVKLNYSSKWNTHVLSRWIVENNYLLDLKKDFFQILCHNCNLAKGMKKNNNECPMKNKPH